MTDLPETRQIYEESITDDGSLNLRSDLLRQIGLTPGDPVRIVIDDGAIKVLPIRFVVSQIASEISQLMADEHVSLDDLLAGLDETGEEVFREIYGDDLVR